MRRIHRGYLVAALVMAVITFAVSLWLFPEWGQSLRVIVSLVVAVVVGVVGFVAAWRQAFDNPPPAPPTVIVKNIIQPAPPPAPPAPPPPPIAQPPSLATLHQIPPPPADFVGREAELKDLVGNFETGAAISGVRGMGGVGKTALALVLAERLQDRFPDAQFFVELKGAGDAPLSPAEALAHVVRAYHPTEKLPEGEAELRALYLSVLHDRRALVLLDDAKDAAQVRPLLPPAGCGLVVTSRQKFTLPGLRATDLDALPPDDARQLLITIAPRLAPPPSRPSTALRSAQGAAMGEGGEGVADEIAKLCGYLPLALRAAGSLLAVTPDLSPEAYAAQLRDERTRLERLGAEGVDRSVEASFNLSYARLSPEAARVFRALAVFPGTFDAAAEEAVCADEGHAQLSDLVRRSLAEYDEKASRYRLHDLARLFAAARLSDAERDEAHQRHAAHYKNVLSAADALYLKGGDSLMRGLALFDLEWTNIQAGQAWAAARAERDDAAARLCSKYPDAGTYCLDLRQHPRELIRWLEAALRAARRLKDRRMEGAHLGNLGLAYAALGEARRAIEFYEQRLVIAREIGDRRGEGADLGNLGLAYADLGETRRAIEFFEQALAISREIGDRRGEGADLGKLGLAYADLGEARRAIEFYEQALAISREIGDRRGGGAALGNLGLAYADLGEARRAIEFYEQALAISREIGDRRGEANALMNTGSAYDSLGEPRRAIDYHEQALPIFREIEDRREEGNALGNLGNAYADLGETRRAIEFYEQALAISREVGDRRGEGNALWNMSLALDKLGERARAVAHAEAALKIFQQIESPYVERVRKQLEEWGEGKHGSAE
jgi:tetratricopeptide (TPR) repeat protein